MKVLYLINREILSPVVESQIIRPASLLARDHEVVLMAIVPIGQMLRPSLRGRIKHLKDRNLQLGVKTVITLGSPSRWRHPRLDTWALKSTMEREVANNGGIVVHARNSEAAGLALDFRERSHRKMRVVFDCRGDEASEVVGAAGFDTSMPETWDGEAKILYRQALARERRAAHEADAMIVVSDAMKGVLMERHGVAAGKITVVPCAVDMDRFSSMDRKEARKRLGLMDNFVVAYLGSVEWYQRLGQAFRIFSVLHKLKKNAVFLAITSQPERMEKEVSKAGIGAGSYRILSVSSDEVPAILCTADLGLLLRRKDPVNAVASPVKCAEYLASGVPVLLTEGIGDYSKILPECGIGWVVDLDARHVPMKEQLVKVMEDISMSQNVQQKLCKDLVGRSFCWDSLKPRLLRCYEN